MALTTLEVSLYQELHIFDLSKQYYIFINPIFFFILTCLFMVVTIKIRI